MSIFRRKPKPAAPTTTPWLTPHVGIAVIDFETTGLDPEKGAEIIEIGVVLLNHHFQYEGHWTTLVRPASNTGKPTKHIHRIKDVDLAVAPLWEDIMDDFLHVIKDRVLVAHNSDFESKFIDRYIPDGVIDGRYAIIDTMPLAARVTGGSMSLRSLAQHCRVNYKAHTAVEDAFALAACLMRLHKVGAVNIPREAALHPLRVNIDLHPTETVLRNSVQAEPLPQVTTANLKPGDRVTVTGLDSADEARLTRMLANRGIVVAGIAKSKTKLVVFSDDMANNHAEDCTTKIQKAVQFNLPMVSYSTFIRFLDDFLDSTAA